MNILFSQVREDPLIEINAIKKIEKEKKKMLLVGSGGCTLFSLISIYGNDINVDVVDNNLEQLYLINLKYQIIKYYKQVDKILDFFEGRLSEKEFKKVLKKLKKNLLAYKYWKDNINYVYKGINQTGKFEQLFSDLVKSDFDFNTVFDKQHLIEIFGQNAVINSLNTEFYDHFKNVFNKYEKKYKPENNYFYHQVLNNCYHKNDLPIYLKNLKNICLYKNKINYFCDDFFVFINNRKDKEYDFIQTSNLTDWMNKEQLDIFVQNIYRCLKKDGVVVMRRLNGDYDLEKYVSEYFEILPENTTDKSLFYSEVVVGKKI